MKGLLSIFLLFSISLVFSQNLKKLKKEADLAFRNDQFRVATLKFDEIKAQEPDDIEVLVKLGIAQINCFHAQAGLENLLFVREKDPSADRYLDYWIARGYHLTSQWSHAIRYYQNYLASLGKYDTRRPAIVKNISECGFGEEFSARPGNYKIVNAGPALNTEHCEHSPILAQDGSMLIFTSRNYSKQVNKSGSPEANFYEHIYYSKRDENENWSQPALFPVNIEEHTATVQLFDNDTKLILYESVHRGDLFISELMNETWSDPKPIEEINTHTQHEDHAYINVSGDLMVFSSSRNSEDGTLDLFSCRKNEDGSWSEPQNLGPHINTQYDEDSPFITTDGKWMYFSSKGHNSIGGYDVFKCAYDESTGTWGEPENLGVPLNTPHNDIYFYFTNENNWSGYLSSFREGGYGENDLYEVTFVPNIYLNGVVADYESSRPVGGLEIHFIDAETKELVAKTVSAKDVGKYRVNIAAEKDYSIKVLQDGEVISSAFYQVPPVEQGSPLSYKFDIHVDISSEEMVAVNETAPVMIDDPIIIEEEIDSEAEQVVVEQPELKEENVFVEEVHESEPQLVMNDSEPQEPKEPKAVNPNEIEGDGREASYYREEEFIPGSVGPQYQKQMILDQKVLDPIAAEQAYIQYKKSIGDYVPQEHTNYMVNNYVPTRSNVKREASNNMIILPETKEDPVEYFGLSSVEKGEGSVLHNVYFGFDEYKIGKGSYYDLGQLVNLMKEYPELEVEIGGHTDAIGPNFYNKKLSSQRAQAVVNFLVNQGVKEDRLTSIGYGEERPLASNDDEKEGRELNRRTEFRIIGVGYVINE
jgi:outer membrane protein OmpA-like peptidoglycan-associated protein